MYIIYFRNKFYHNTTYDPLNYMIIKKVEKMKVIILLCLIFGTIATFHHFSGQISKKDAGHFEEHKKLGRQPNFQKFLATGGLINPKRRLIGGRHTLNNFCLLCDNKQLLKRPRIQKGCKKLLETDFCSRFYGSTNSLLE